MRYDADRLYRIETNTGYAWHPAEPAVVAEVADAFGLARPTTVARLEKPNAASQLYRAAAHIFRAAPIAEAAAVERQAEILGRVDYAHVIKPRARTIGDRVWTVYPERRGELFDGVNCTPEHAIAEGLNLLAALAALEVDTALLPGVPHAPAAWPAFVGGVRGDSPETTALLDANRSELVELAERIGALARRPTLVHDDLNHANVLVVEGRPFFLDLEDLRLEDREIAAAHAVFKLVRHAVYTGAVDPADARGRVLPACLHLLDDRGFAAGDAAVFFELVAYRIVSELHRMDASSRYDRDKKVANLFELYDLLHDGSRAG